MNFKQISVILTRLVRPSDTLARLGGDEFGVLITDCDETWQEGGTKPL